MITRIAFFEGKVKPGAEAAFDAFVQTRLLPLWSAFPNLIRVRLVTKGETDVDDRAYALIVVFEYPSHAAMDEALASDIRQQSRETTKEIFAFFDGRIHHVVGEFSS